MTTSVTFPVAVGGDGSTVDDSTSSTTGLDNGGFRTRLLPAFTNIVNIAQNTVNQAANAASSATAAAASAASASSTVAQSASTSATSTTSMTVGLGSQPFTLAQTGKAYSVGQQVRIAYTTTPTTWMDGTITAYNSSTGAITVNVTNISGSGTQANWTISVSGAPGTSGVVNELKGNSIAAASTVNLDAATGNLVHITGSAIINTITLAAGSRRTVVFDGVCTLTNSSNLACATNANIVTAAGDMATMYGDGGGVTLVTDYIRKSGMPTATINGLFPIGGMLSFDNDVANGQNSYTAPTGEVYLKTGVIADTSVYPNAPAAPWGSLTTNGITMGAPGGATGVGGIASNGTIMVAGINGGGLYRSIDGFTWTNTGVSVGAGLVSVVYANGVFLATPATSAAAYRSTDGINWTQVGTVPIATAHLCFGNGTWVAIPTASTTFAYSTNNGTSWSTTTSPLSLTAAQPGGANDTASAVAYGAGLFVAIQLGTASGNYVTSPDGITWTSRTSLTAPTTGFTNIVFGGTKFVIQSNETTANSIRWSTDGLTWNNVTVSALLSGYMPIGYINGKFVQVSTNASQSSADAITWTQTTCSTNGAATFYATLNGYYVTHGYNGTAGQGKSFDGITFFGAASAAVISQTNPVSDLNYGNNRFFHTISWSPVDPHALQWSSDGISWFAAIPTGNSDAWRGSAYFNSLYCVAGGTYYYTSPDMVTWTLRTSPTNIGGTACLSVANGRLYSFAGSSVAAFSYSADGISFSNGTFPASATWTSVVYGNALYIAHDATGANYATSTDGLTWTTRTPTGISGTFSSRILFASGYFIANTANGWYKSTDGLTWTAIPYGYGGTWTSGACTAMATDGTTVVGINGSYLHVWNGGASMYRRVMTSGMSAYTPRCAALNANSFVTRTNANASYVTTMSATNKVLNDVNYKTYNSTAGLQLDMYKRVA